MKVCLFLNTEVMLFPLLLLFASLPCRCNKVEIKTDGKKLFTEDQRSIFRCCLQEDAKDATIAWSLLQETNGSGSQRPLFHVRTDIDYRYRNQSESGCRNLTLIMRRDFQNSYLNCTAKVNGTSLTDIFHIRNIKKTIEIDDVQLVTKDVKFGDPITLTCKVKSKIHIKEMRIRLESNFYNLTKISSKMKDGYTFYSYTYKVNGTFQVERMHGMAIQCIAVTQNFSFDTGNVFSPIERLFVEYMKFLKWPCEQYHSQRNVMDNKHCYILFIRAHPKPKNKDFKIEPEEDVEERRVEIRNACVPQQPEIPGTDFYMIIITFTAKRSGNYALRYNGRSVIDKGPNVAILKPENCESCPNTWLIIGVILIVVIAVCIMVIIIVIIYKCWWKNRNQNRNQPEHIEMENSGAGNPLIEPQPEIPQPEDTTTNSKMRKNLAAAAWADDAQRNETD